MLPNFIIFGVARCGSTALHEYIQQHPDVFMSDPKEPHFFSFEGERLSFTGPGDDLMINKVAITEFDKYQRLFDGAGNAKAVGEASIEYGYYPKAVAGIQKYVPDARLVCMIRNPADRAFSAFSFMRSRLFEPFDRFEDALADEDRRVAAGWHHIWHYRRMSYFYPQLKRYFDAFPHAQIKVYLYENFSREPLAVVRDAFEFLGIDPSFTPSRTPQTVVGGIPKNLLLHRVLMGVWSLKAVLRPLIPEAVRRPLWRRLHTGNLRRDTMDPRTREQLLSEFRSDIHRTQELIGQDLSAWLPPTRVRP